MPYFLRLLHRTNYGKKKPTNLRLRAEIQTLEGVGGDKTNYTATQQINLIYFLISPITKTNILFHYLCPAITATDHVSKKPT